MNQTDSEERTAQDALPLYDANTQQRIPFLLEADEGQAVVCFNLKPQTDEVLIEHERQRNLRLVQADLEATGGVHGVEAKARKLEASALLFDAVAESVEGLGEEGEQLPENWKDFIEVKDKADVIDQAYLACEAVKPEVAQKLTRLPWNYRGDTKTYTLRAIFEGYELELKHRLRKASASEFAEYNSIMSQSYLVQGARVMQGETLIPPRLARLRRLYRKLVVSFEGYRGYPPLHHQAEAVMTHLGSVFEAMKKKSSSAQPSSSAGSQSVTAPEGTTEQ